jgi:hypothetical protein
MVLERLRENRSGRDSCGEQVALAVAYVAGLLESVAESQRGARLTAMQAAALRALVAFYTQVWAEPDPVPLVEERAGLVGLRREALF